MKAIKYHELDAAELERQSQDAQEQIFRLRFQIGMGQTEGLKKYRNLRKDRARMLTVLNEKGTDSNRTVPQVKAADTAGKSKKKK
jgi:large subunit ribosomal protein L29